MEIKSFLKEKEIYFYSIIILLVNFFSRLPFINKGSLWYDEGFTAFHSNGGFFHIIETCSWDINPPGYLHIMYIWQSLFGTTEWSLRISSLLFMSIAGMLIFILAYKFLNKQTAFISSILFLASNYIFHYSHEVRQYSFGIALIALSWILLFSLLKKEKIYKAVILGIVMGYIVYSHYIFGFAVVVNFMFLFVKRRKIFDKYIWISIFSFILTINVWWIRIFKIFFQRTGSTAPKTWLPFSSLSLLKTTIFDFFNNSVIFYIISFIFIALFIYLIVKNKLKKEESFKILFFAISSIGVLATIFFISLKIPMWKDRYFLYVIPAFIILFSYVLSLADFNKYLKFIPIIALSIYAFFFIDFNWEAPMNYRSATQFVKKDFYSDSLLIIQQSKDPIGLLSFYIDKEANKNPKIAIEIMKKHNIFCINSFDEFKSLPLHNADTIVMFRVWHKNVDPESLVETFMNENFVKILDERQKYKGVELLIFKRNFEQNKIK